MQQSPNRLGTVLQYFVAGYRYAFPVTTEKAVPRRISFDLLDAIADANKYSSNETVNVAEAMKLAITSAWFYSGTKIIADRVSSTDARPVMKKRIGKELRNQPGHDFERLLDQPNSMMTWEFISRYTVGWMQLLGNAYLFVSTPAPGIGRPDELWPLPANAVTPKPSSIRISILTGKPVIDYEYTLNGKTRILPGENVIHFRYANPFDYWLGLSPLTALMDAVRLDRWQSKYLQGFFGKDNAIPTAIISIPSETLDDDFDTIKEEIRSQFGEGRRSAITRAGDMSVQVITQTLQQMEIIGGRKFNREEVNHVLGIPDGLVSGGLSGDSRLATEITFARNTTQPLLDLIASTLDSALSPYYGPGFVICAPSIIPQDRAMAVSEYTTYSPHRSIIENRQVLNLPPMNSVSIMDEINAIREAAGYERITQPLDDIMIDLMLRLPVALIPVISSNTSALAGKTGLRVGQKDADGQVVESPIPEPLQDTNEPGGSPAASEDALRENNTGAGNLTAPKKVGDSGSSVSGAHFAQANAGRSWSPTQLAAIKLGQSEELSRWKRVAQRIAKEGGNPAEKEFSTNVLPSNMVGSILKQIAGADEARVVIVFDTVSMTLQEMEL